MEDRTLRGLHPLVAERLGLWRLSGFELTRLPAAPDVHLFHARGRHVPADQRLIALADVRDLTVMRDPDGRIRGLPQLERALDACLDSLRSARSADREAAKLDWNRVMLHVWPVTDIPSPSSARSCGRWPRALGPWGWNKWWCGSVARGERAAPRGHAADVPAAGAGLTLRVTDPPSQPLRELNPYTQNVIRARRRAPSTPTSYPADHPLAGPRRHRGHFHRIRP